LQRGSGGVHVVENIGAIAGATDDAARCIAKHKSEFQYFFICGDSKKGFDHKCFSPEPWARVLHRGIGVVGGPSGFDILPIAATLAFVRDDATVDIDGRGADQRCIALCSVVSNRYIVVGSGENG